MNRKNEVMPSRKPYKVEGPSMTKQAPHAGTKLDAILRKYATIGVEGELLVAGIAKQPYGIQPSTDYQQQLNMVVKVQDYFRKLPSSIREKFKNDPALMIEFLSDERNAEEAAELGLVEKKQKEASSSSGPGSPAGVSPASDPNAPKAPAK